MLEGVVASQSLNALTVEAPQSEETLLDDLLEEASVDEAFTEPVAEPAALASEVATAETEPVAVEPAESVAPAPVGGSVQASSATGGTASADVTDREPLNDSPRVPLDNSDTAPAHFNLNQLAATPATNPPLPEQCGIDVAVVLDMSTSLSNSDVTNSRTAARAVVTALEGTPSSVGVYYFGTRGHRAIAKTPVASAAGANTVRSAVDSVGRPSWGTNFTNWDEPLQMVNAEGANYDVVLFVTDGEPNRYGTGQSSQGTAVLDAAITSANVLKASGTTVLGVGVGSSINVQNIQAISGPGSYYTVANYGALVALMTSLAEDNCRGTVSVVKEVRGIDGELSLAGGWDFSSSLATPGGTITPATASTANDTGAVNFDIQHPTAESVVVNITETQQAGYSLEQQDGFNAICRDNSTQANIPVTNVGESGWTLTVGRTQVVSCSVINQQVLVYEPLTVSKTATGSLDVLYEWDIDKLVAQDEYTVVGGSDVDIDYDVDVTQVARTVTDMNMGGTITVSNPNDRPMVATLSDQLASGQQCTIQGVTDVDPVAPGLQINVPADGLSLTYDCVLTAEPASLSDSNTVTLTWDRALYPQTQEQFLNPGSAGTGTASSTVPFTYDVTETDKTITVSDTQVDDDWSVTWDEGKGAGFVHTNSYTVTQTPEAGKCVVYDNTATIVDTDAEASQSVTVCAGTDLVIDKTTVQSFDRSYLWDIEKVADDTSYTADPDTGDVTVDYTVTVTPSGYLDSEWVMTGEITVTNPNVWQDVPATITDVADFGPGAQCVVTGVVADPSIVDEDPDTDGFQAVIPADTTLVFQFDCSFSEQPDYDGSNTATVSWDADEAATPNASATDIVDVVAADWDRTPINQSVKITDSEYTFLGGWNVNQGDGPQSRTYPVTWNVAEAGTCVVFSNTVTLTGIDGLVQTDTEDITACREAAVTVTKTVDASYDRVHLWEIDKSLPEGDPAQQVVDENGEATFTYNVVANSTGYVDSGWEMTGVITVSNPNDYTDIVVTVSDTTNVPGATCVVDAAADLDPGTTGIQVSVPASGSVDIGYSCDVPELLEADYTGHTNTATVTTEDGLVISSAPVAVTFALDDEVDAQVDVVDDKTDPANPVVLGTADVHGTLPWSASYDVTFLATPDQCTDYVNTAWVDVTGDNPEADVTITVCDQEDLTVTKTVDARFDRGYEWTIDKSADETLMEVAGDGTATAEYTVVTTASDPIDTGKTVAGTITVTNPNTDVGPIEVTVTEDLHIDGAVCTFEGADANADVDGFQVVLDDGEVANLGYSCEIPAETDIDETYTNDVTIEWGIDESVTYTAEVVFVADEVVNDEVTVTDTMMGRDTETVTLGTVEVADSPATFTYAEVLDVVPGQCVDYDNTATIVETGDTADETVTVCGGSDLVVDKNVIHSMDRTYLWDIDKDVDETSLVVDSEGLATFNYTVTATPILPPNGWEDGGWAMSGEITVSNPNEWLDITADVTDSVDIGGGAVCAVLDGTDAVIAAGETVTFTYTCLFTSQPAYDGTNRATVTWADTYPTPGTSATGTATITEANWDTTPINDVVTIVDDKTDPANPVTLGEATWNEDGTPTVFTYALELEGEAGTCISHTNIAWIDETQQSASVDVEVCDRLPLDVSKTVSASYDRTYLWDIDKSADETEIRVDSATGEADFSYLVSAIPDGYVDSGWEMSGQITVTNPNDFESATVTIADVADVGGSTCTVNGSTLTIEPSGSVTVDYSCSFEEQPDYEGTNTAVVDTDLGTFTETVDVVFELDAETDRSVMVVDDKTDPVNPVELGTAEWNEDGTPIEFTYELNKIGVPGQCIDYTNTAWIEVAGEDPTTSLDTELCVEIDVDVDKTVRATYDRDFHWHITKDVDRTSVTVDKETGEADFAYVVSAIPDGYTDSGWAMSGDISVHNPNRFHPIEVTVADLVDIPYITCTVDGGVAAEIGPEETVTFGYDCEFEAMDDDAVYEGTNVASVMAGGELFSDVVDFTFEVDVETDKSVEVIDDQTDPEAIVTLGTAEWNEDGTPIEFEYTLTHVGVPGQCITLTNNAWLETEVNPEASVDAELCVESPLGVALADDVVATFDREYLWNIDKAVNETSVHLDSGGSALLHYTVAATPDGYVDSGHLITGSFTVTNPNTFADRVVTIEHTVNFDGATCEIAAVDYDEDTFGLQLLIPAQVDDEPGTVHVQFVCDGEPDTYVGEIGVTATYTDFDEAEQVSVATRDVEYVMDEETNKVITVLDDKTEPTNDPVVLGTATWNPEGTPTEFDYSMEFEGVPGETVEYTNTAWIQETDQSDDVTVKVTTEQPLFPAKPTPPATPAGPTPGGKPTLPLTGLNNTAWLLSIGGIAALLGTGLIVATNRRKEE